MFKPIAQAGQGKGEEALRFGAVERAIGRAGCALVILNGGGLGFWLELRPARGDERADLVAGKGLAAGKVEQDGRG